MNQHLPRTRVTGPRRRTLAVALLAVAVLALAAC
jgi:hypothetical protein